MSRAAVFALGLLVGGLGSYHVKLPGLHGDGPDVYLNGGSFSSSTIGVIYGYVNDYEGCAIHAAGMNFYYQSDAVMQAKIMEAKGNSFCSIEAIK